MRNSRHAFKRRRRAPISSTVTYYRRTPIGDQRVDKVTVAGNELTHAERMIAAGQRGLSNNPDALAVSAAGWDQDNS